MPDQLHTLTAEQVERGRETPAERRERLGILSVKEWRERIEQGVAYRMRSDRWSDDDRAEVTAEVWLDACERIARRTDTIGRRIQRAVLSFYGVPMPELLAAPLASDPEHSTVAYSGRASNFAAAIAGKRDRSKPLAAERDSADDATADDFAADSADDDDDAQQDDVSAFQAAVGAEQAAARAELLTPSQQGAADARQSAARLAERIGLPVYDLCYVAARAHGESLKLTDAVCRELRVEHSALSKRVERQRAAIRSECDGEATALLRYLLRRDPNGAEPRSGHVVRTASGPTWMPTTALVYDATAKALRREAVLIYSGRDDSDRAKRRRGRTLAAAAERRREREVWESITVPDPELDHTPGDPHSPRAEHARSLCEVRWTDAAEPRGQSDTLAAQIERVTAPMSAARRAALAIEVARAERMPSGEGRAVSTAAAAAHFTLWQDAHLPAAGTDGWLQPMTAAERDEREAQRTAARKVSEYARWRERTGPLSVVWLATGERASVRHFTAAPYPSPWHARLAAETGSGI